MDNNTNKILSASYMILAGITYIVARVLVETLSTVSGFFARLSGSDLVHHGVPVFLGVLVFALLQFNPKINAWATDVVVELKKVVWPSRKDTTAMTIVVCIMLLISGVVIGAFDFLSAKLDNLIVG